MRNLYRNITPTENIASKQKVSLTHIQQMEYQLISVSRVVVNCHWLIQSLAYMGHRKRYSNWIFSPFFPYTLTEGWKLLLTLPWFPILEWISISLCDYQLPVTDPKDALCSHIHMDHKNMTFPVLPHMKWWERHPKNQTTTNSSIAISF